MTWQGRVAWLPWALLLLWGPGEGLPGLSLPGEGGCGGGQGRRRRSALESALQSLEQGVLCPARTWTDGRTEPRRGQTWLRSSTPTSVSHSGVPPGALWEVADELAQEEGGEGRWQHSGWESGL